MRLTRRIVPLVVLSMMLLGLAVTAYAQYNPFGDMKLPQVNPPAMNVGQSGTYNISVSGIPDLKAPLNAKLRLAIVGKEAIEGKDYFWVEMDLSDLKGLPAEAEGMMKTLRVKCLMQNVPPGKYQDDPKAAMNAIASGQLIRKVIFQLNEDTPQVLDFMTIQGMVQGMTGQDLQTMVNSMPMEPAAKDVKDKVDIKTGKENVTVPAGTFTNADYVSFKGADETTSGEGKVYAHASVPITAFVKMTMNINDTSDKSNIKIGIDLADYKTSGATSYIKGEPIPFDFQKLFETMGGPGMGGASSSEK